ncbi:MAG: LysR substrate-binding domain-containing protein, partial [Rikenellaceae bacterium]
FNTIRESVADLKGEISGKLRLGVIPTISPYLTHRFVPDFVKKYPKVELEICDMITTDIVDALKRDKIDAAIVAGGTCGEGIIEHPLFKDRFYVYVSPDNRLYNSSNITIEDINLHELILLSTGNCMRDQVLELCIAKQSMPSDYSFVSCSIETLMRIVDSTKLMTIIPEIALEYIPQEKMNRVKMLSSGSGHRIISTAVSRTYVKSSLIKALNDSITSTISPLIGL